MKLTKVYEAVREYIAGPKPHDPKTLDEYREEVAAEFTKPHDPKTLDEYREEVAAEFTKRFEPLGIELSDMPHMLIYIETIAKIRYEYQM